MLRHSKHERSGLYDLLSTRAEAFARTLRVPQDDIPHTFDIEICHG